MKYHAMDVLVIGSLIQAAIGIPVIAILHAVACLSGADKRTGSTPAKVRQIPRAANAITHCAFFIGCTGGRCNPHDSSDSNSENTFYHVGHLYKFWLRKGYSNTYVELNNTNAMTSLSFHI